MGEHETEPDVPRKAWQVFRFTEGEEIVDGRLDSMLVCVGVVTGTDAPYYWTPDAQLLGDRFGEGRYLLFDDQAIQKWEAPSRYDYEGTMFFDIVAETTFRTREPERPGLL